MESELFFSDKTKQSNQRLPENPPKTVEGTSTGVVEAPEATVEWRKKAKPVARTFRGQGAGLTRGGTDT